MKTLIIDVYRFVYKFSRAKMFSVGVAVIYITILNMVVLCGLCLLLEGWMPTSYMRKLFIFPYYLFTGAIMLYVTALFKPSQKAISKEAKKANNYTFIIVYSLAGLILFLYLRYGDKIVFNEKKINVKPPRPSYTKSAFPVLPTGWLAILKENADNYQG